MRVFSSCVQYRKGENTGKEVERWRASGFSYWMLIPHLIVEELRDEPNLFSQMQPKQQMKYKATNPKMYCKAGLMANLDRWDVGVLVSRVAGISQETSRVCFLTWLVPATMVWVRHAIPSFSLVEITCSTKWVYWLSKILFKEVLHFKVKETNNWNCSSFQMLHIFIYIWSSSRHQAMGADERISSFKKSLFLFVSAASVLVNFTYRRSIFR